jgi:hypothetical protein
MAPLARRVLVALLLCVAAIARAADPVAFVSDIKGDVLLDGVGRPPFLAELLPGSRLVLAAEAGAAVMYVVSGQEFTLKGPGEFVVEKQRVRAVKGVAPASRVPPLRASTAALVETSKAATASLRMRSAPPPKGEPAGPQYPAGGRIATLQPTLRWGGDPEATYLLVVTSAGGKEFFRGSAKGNSLHLPSRLMAGQSYSWNCSAGGVASGESRFETMPADAIRAAEKARSGARTFGDRVLLALVLKDLGAAQDAREVWAQLAAERPDIPEIAGLSR